MSLYSVDEAQALLELWQTFTTERRSRLWVLASYADLERGLTKLAALAVDEARTLRATALVGHSSKQVVIDGHKVEVLLPQTGKLADLLGSSPATQHRRYWRGLRHLVVLMNGADELPSIPDEEDE